MKRTYIFFIIAALCALGVSAKTIHIWRNGVKTDLSIQTNDSITFDETNAPTMHIWRNGSEIYQLALAVNDSITYSSDSAVTPPASGFDYDHWREQTAIAIYNPTTDKLQMVNLPWAPVASTSMPDEYKHPEKELLADSVTPRWQLAFNLCDSVSLPGVDMFGLWDEHSQIMRIYTNVEQLPNPNATSCFYQVTSSAPAFLDGDTKGWMPADSTIQTCSWGTTMGSSLPVPSTKECNLIPITGTLTGVVNQGWICYELNFSAGLFNVPKDANITFTLLAVNEIAFTGGFNFSATMESYGGKITVPGSGLKLAAGIVEGSGNILQTIIDGVKGGGGVFSALAGMIGGATQGVGKILTGVAESKEKTYQLDLNFNVSGSGQINGSLSSNVGTSVPPAQLDYSMLFDQVISHKGGADATSITAGAWNLKRQPVLYVSSDMYFNMKGMSSGGFFGKYKSEERSTLLSFLDPTSIELMLNTDSTLFPYKDIDSVKVLAYDFMFTEDSYQMPMQPYYAYYGIHQDNVRGDNTAASIELSYWEGSQVEQVFKPFLLDTTATPTVKTYGSNHIITTDEDYFVYETYSGVPTAFTAEGMPTYSQLFSPSISYNTPDTTVNNIGVAVILEVDFKNGEKRLFADRFLPQIKALPMRDILDLRNRFTNTQAPSTMDGIAIDYTLFEEQKQKALRLTDSLAQRLEDPYPVVFLDGDTIGIRIREYKDADTLGLVLVTGNDMPYGPYSQYSTKKTAVFLHNYIDDLQAWDAISAKLEFFGMPSLNNYFLILEGGDDVHWYQMQTDEESFINKSSYLFHLYSEDADGNLTRL